MVISVWGLRKYFKAVSVERIYLLYTLQSEKSWEWIKATMRRGKKGDVILIFSFDCGILSFNSSQHEIHVKYSIGKHHSDPLDEAPGWYLRQTPIFGLSSLMLHCKNILYLFQRHLPGCCRCQFLMPEKLLAYSYLSWLSKRTVIVSDTKIGPWSVEWCGLPSVFTDIATIFLTFHKGIFDISHHPDQCWAATTARNSCN